MSIVLDLPEMKTSYHVHTRWSDGQRWPKDYILAARAQGLDELGFSDHYAVHPSGMHVGWSIPENRLDRYIAEITEIANRAPSGLTVRLGVEIDYFPGQEEAIQKLLDKYSFDYVIGSIHFFGEFPIDEAAERWKPLSQEERDEIIRGYWHQVTRMAESRLFDVAGHLDLTKKFGYRASADLHAEIGAALDAIADSRMIVELNTAGWHVPVGEQYPSLDILEGCFARGIPVVLTADAHRPEDLTRDYYRAYALLRKVGYRDLVSFSRRDRFTWPIP